MVNTAAIDPTKIAPATGTAVSRFAAVIAPALQSGYRSAVEQAVLDASVNHELSDAVHLVGAGLAALDGRPFTPIAISGNDELVRELLMALPLIATAQAGASYHTLARLPVPAISGSRGALWRLVRSMLAYAAGDDLQRRRLVDLAAAYRNGSFLADCAQRKGFEDWSAWLVVLAQLGHLTSDKELCRVTCAALTDSLGEFVVLGSFVPLGPVGWFLAQPLALLGQLEQAQEANRQADRLSRAMRSNIWVARCRQQRRDVGLTETPPVAAAQALIPVRSVQVLAHSDRPAVSDPSPKPTPEETSDSSGPVTDGLAALTARQLEILRLAASGLTNAQIAQRLFVSVATVERHSTMTYRALGVRNRAQALGLLAAAREPAPR